MTVRRNGFSLAELMVALVIAGILGIALSRLLINQSRFVSMQDGMMQARSAGRAALIMMSHDLRSVTDGGLVAATPDSITVRVPFAFGIACQQGPNHTEVSLLPTDSSTYFAAVGSAAGYAWQGLSGSASYTSVEPATVSNGTCTQLPLDTIKALAAPGWTARSVRVTPKDTLTPRGAVVYLYQLIRYAFAPSVELPGRRALWRQILPGGARDEMVVPFDSSARFGFLVGNAYALQATLVSPLDSVRGIRVSLVGASETAPQNRSAPVKFDLTTDILFRNNARP